MSEGSQIFSLQPLNLIIHPPARGSLTLLKRKSQPSERSDVRLKKKFQPAKRSLIRCIELVVDTGEKPTARRKTSGSWQPSSCKQGAICTEKKDEKMEETVHGNDLPPDVLLAKLSWDQYSNFRQCYSRLLYGLHVLIPDLHITKINL